MGRTKTGVVGKSHSDIFTTLVLHNKEKLSRRNMGTSTVRHTTVVVDVRA